MITIRETMNESHPATPDSVGVIRHAVADYAIMAGIRGEQLDDVRLAVSEAVTNVVIHAYRQDQGEVHMTAKALEDELWVLISDDGCGYNTQPAHKGLGWGLALITEACDEFTLLERAEGGTEAQMRFALPPFSPGVSSAGQ